MKYLILLLIIASAVLYVRGSMKIIKAEKVDCQWHLVYAFCEGKKPTPPGFLEAIKQGYKF